MKAKKKQTLNTEAMRLGMHECLARRLCGIEKKDLVAVAVGAAEDVDAVEVAC